MLEQLWNLVRRQRPNQGIEPFYEARSRLAGFALLSLFMILALRAVSIHLMSPSADILETLARRQYQSKIDLSPYRGNIYDRRGEPLAISIRRPSFYVNPRIFDPTSKQIQSLAAISNLSAAHIKKLAKQSNYFAWLTRKIEVDKAKQINALAIPGLFEITEPARYYPNGQELAALIGSVGLDNHGLQGIELANEALLQGESLSSFRNRDARGQTIYRDSLLALPEKNGKNIILTIDSAIQNISQRALVKGLEKARAHSGFVIISDPHTGRILAIANAVGQGRDAKVNSELFRNRALTNLFEPGSVVKPLVIGRALELGLVTLDEVHQT